MLQELTPKTYDDNVLGNSNNYAYKILKAVPADAAYYYHTDHLMTPLAITASDQTTAWSAVLYPFGSLYSESGSAVSNLRFPGQYADAAVDNARLYYHAHRWYGTKQGRYLMPDPMPFLGVDPSIYGYAQNRPILFTDRLGLQTGQEYAFGEIREWCGGRTAPAGLPDAVASMGAICRSNTCAHMSGANSAPGPDQNAWNNIVNATGGTDQHGSANFMCVDFPAQCWVVDRCDRCTNGQQTRVNRTTALTATSTVTVGIHTLYFYTDDLQGWCNQTDYRNGCHCPTCR
jgi:RHS repeat-associated protein